MTTTALPRSSITDDIAKTATLSPWQLAWRRFRKHKMALISLGGLIVIFLYVFFGGALFARGLCDPTGVFVTGEAYANCNDTSIKLQPPSQAHFFGTDTIGRDILARQQQQGWGAKVIDRLARDLHHEFPDLKGFSTEPDLGRLADLRYQGQSYELTVDGDTPAALAEAFHRAHLRRYGHREDDEPVEVVNVRLVATVVGEQPDVIEPGPPTADPRTGSRDVVLDGARVRADVLDRELMGRGSTVRAPAVVEFGEATCLIRPGWGGVIDSVGTLVLSREQA